MSPETWLEFATGRAEPDSFFREGADHLRQALADRDRLAAELARVRRNHLRNQLKRAELHARTHTQIAKQGPMSTRPMSPKTLRRAARNRDRWRKVVEALRAALAQPQDGTTEGRG